MLATRRYEVENVAKQRSQWTETTKFCCAITHRRSLVACSLPTLFYILASAIVSIWNHFPLVALCQLTIHSVDEVKSCQTLIKKTLVQVLSRVRFPKPQIFDEIFCTNLQSPVWSRHVGVCHRRTPTWRPENSVNIWNLLWLSRRLIICTEQTSIYVATFPKQLYVTHRHSSEIQNALVSRRNELEISINPLLYLMKITNFGGSLILDFRKWRRHVQAKNTRLDA